MTIIQMHLKALDIRPTWTDNQGASQMSVSAQMSNEQMKAVFGEFLTKITAGEFAEWIKELAPDYLHKEDIELPAGYLLVHGQSGSSMVHPTYGNGTFLTDDCFIQSFKDAS